MSDRLEDLHGGSLRTHAARGTLINSAFVVGLGLLQFARGIVLAALLVPSDYGVWGILVASLGTLGILKQIGISDKFVQQDEDDQEHAFHRAFTLEVWSNVALGVLMLAAVPLMALAYGEHEVLLPGIAFVLIVPALALQAPIWILYRQMRFARQRALQAIDPVIGFVVAVVLAAVGASYWSFVIAAFVGAWGTGLAAWRTCPYPLKLVPLKGQIKDYVAFSAPLLVAALGVLVLTQGSVLLGSVIGGLAAAGAITLAAQVTQFTNKVDQVLTDTLYPAICAAADQTEVLFESFVKSNRLALMWALPFGFGLALFAPYLVDLGWLDGSWEPAIIVLQCFGAASAIGHLGFNWTAYFKARADTKPIAVHSTISALAFLAIQVPLAIAFGLEGFGYGMFGVVLTSLAVRWFYLRRMFAGLRLLPHAVRSLAPAVPAVGAVLAVRAVSDADVTLGLLVAEIGLYLAVTAAATVAAERTLLGEALGYLRGKVGGGAPPRPI